MNAQRIAIGTVVGGIVFTLVGYLVFGIVFADFFAGNAGSATGVTKDPIDFVSLVIGQLAWGALLTVILESSSASSVAKGVRTGAVTGLLFMLGMDFTLFATTNMSNLTATVVDPILAAVVFAVAGGAIAAVTGRK